MNTALKASIFEDYKELLSDSLARFALAHGRLPDLIVVSADVFGFLCAAHARMPCRVIIDKSMPAQAVRIHAARRVQPA